MSNQLTKDQVLLLFQLFIAQNADKKISDLFPSDDEYRQETMGNLEIDISDYSIRLTYEYTVYFRYIFEQKNFETWDSRMANWYSFDIFKFISLEDKV